MAGMHVTTVELIQIQFIQHIMPCRAYNTLGSRKLHVHDPIRCLGEVKAMILFLMALRADRILGAVEGKFIKRMIATDTFRAILFRPATCKVVAVEEQRVCGAKRKERGQSARNMGLTKKGKVHAYRKPNPNACLIDQTTTNVTYLKFHWFEEK
jgi:hypothetical protein